MTFWQGIELETSDTKQRDDWLVRSTLLFTGLGLGCASSSDESKIICRFRLRNGKCESS